MQPTRPEPHRTARLIARRVGRGAPEADGPWVPPALPDLVTRIEAALDKRRRGPEDAPTAGD